MPKEPASEAAFDQTACNCLAVRQAARHITQAYERHLAPEGLRASQYSILSKLNRLGPLSIGELANTMVMDRTTLGRAIRPLERDRLLVVGDGQDGRTRSVRLTTAGIAKVKSAATVWRKAQREFETAFGAREAAGLRSTLFRLVSAT
jgi:DNA-binding MarR family transcriptional regulator